MEPTGTKTYKDYEIRYYDPGSTIELYTEDYVRVVPKVAEHLMDGEFNLFDVEVAGPAASSYGGAEEFTDWIHQTFYGPPPNGSDE